MEDALQNHFTLGKQHHVLVGSMVDELRINVIHDLVGLRLDA